MSAWLLRQLNAEPAYYLLLGWPCDGQAHNAALLERVKLLKHPRAQIPSAQCMTSAQSNRETVKDSTWALVSYEGDCGVYVARAKYCV